MGAANWISQRIAHSSTDQNAGELNFRVRDGYGWNLTALAALMPTNGIEPLSYQYRSGRLTNVSVQSSLRLDPFSGLSAYECGLDC